MEKERSADGERGRGFPLSRKKMRSRHENTRIRRRTTTRRYFLTASLWCTRVRHADLNHDLK